MPLVKKEELKAVEIKMDADAPAILKQVPIGPEQGWEGWVMRIFTLEKGGNTPFHTHDWPHINYVIAGEGTVFIDGEAKAVAPGDTAYIKGGEKHQFRNTGEAQMSFICIVPEEGEQ